MYLEAYLQKLIDRDRGNVKTHQQYKIDELVEECLQLDEDYFRLVICERYASLMM